MFQFPFGTMHQLNLDWFLQQWQQLRQDWIDEEQHIEDSMQDVYDARDAAIQAKDDAVAAKNDAESAQAGVNADALMAEGFAVGEQNGTPVGPGSPYYQVNAKFYSTNAGTYRYLSEAYARGTMGGTPVDPGDAGYEDNAKYYKDAADLDAQSASADAGFAAADALVAEGWAKGEQNGVPVSSGDPYYEDNAKYYAGACAQDKSDTDTLKDAANAAALRAEGWAVGEQNGTPVASGSPYYENNAEYYKDLAASVVLGADGAAAQAMIAGEEVSTTLTADYTAGSYIRVQGVLYKTTIDLETGDTLTVGTNCEVATIGSDLKNDESRLFNIDGFAGSNSATSTQSFVTKNIIINIPIKAGQKLSVLFKSQNHTSTIFLYVGIMGAPGSVQSAQMTTSETEKTINYTSATDELLTVYFQIGTNDPTTVSAVCYITPAFSMIAPVLAGMYADTSLVRNDLRICNNNLYRVTTAINSGAALIEGTNVEKTTLATLIKPLLT